MKNLLTLLITLFTTAMFSQHITVDTVDKFTKNKEVQVNASKGKNWSNSDGITKNAFKGSVFLSTKLIKSPEGDLTSYLNLNIQSGSILCFGGDKIIILLSNDDTLTLNQISPLECNTVNNVRYHITKESINILKNNSIESLRAYTRDGYIDYEIKEKSKPIIQKTFELTANKLKEIE